MTSAKLPVETRIGRVDLTVRDLERETRFYVETLGMRELARREGVVELGAEAPIVVLHHDPEAPPRPRMASGLYHMAILLPTRAALAGVIRRLVEKRHPIQGASDHRVSEALYLADPEGNGIEIYADRPRETWERLGESIQMGTAPMDVDDVLTESPTPIAQIPQGTRMGHVHLQVGDVRTAEAWYRDVLGFDVTASMGEQASFLSAGGYHHHVGMNSWNSRGAPPAKGGELGLKSFTILVPGLEKEREARDPAGNVVVLAPG